MDSTRGEPKSELNLNKTEYKEDDEVKVKYKGVRQRKSGKFGSEIIDPNKRRSVWLGTFDSAIEAAKAYDKAAFKMRGDKASLNFPLYFGISPEESNADANAVVNGGRKRTGDGCVTVAVVKTSPQHNGPINAIEVGPSSPPSPQRQSTTRENFKWTDEWLCAMCGILNKHIANNDRNCPFNWADHQLELENICHHKFNTVLALRSKYDAMKVRHNLWKSLKNGETGLRWNESTGKLDCSDDWWEKKIKENPDFKRLRRNQPSRELQVAWDLLFDNVVSNGVDCVDLNTSNQVHHMNLEDKDDGVDCVDLDMSNQGHHVNLEDKDDRVDVSSERTLDSSQFGSQETEEATSISKFGNLAANQGDGCKPSEKIVKSSSKPKCTQMEWKNTESERATMFKEFMTRQNATQQRALKIPKTSNVYQVGDFSISASVSVINRMVEEGLVTSCSELWCFAVNLFEDSVKRELFMSLPDDVGRLAWLQYKKNLGN